MCNKIKKFYLNVKKLIVNSFKFKSIQSTITISYTILTTTAILFMGFTVYNKFSKTAEKNALVSTSQIVEQVNTNLSFYIKGMIDASNIINEELNSSLFNGDSLKNFLNMALRLRKDIVTLAVFSEDGNLITSTYSDNLKKGLDVKKQSWYREVINEPNKLHFSYPHVQNLFSEQHRWVVTLSRQVEINKDNKKYKLISLVDMNFSAINEFCSKVNLGKRGYIYIIDGNGNIIYHPQQQMVYAGLKKENIDFVINKKDGGYIQYDKDNSKLISIKTVKYTNWKIVAVSFYSDMVTTKEDIYYSLIYLLVFIIIIVFSISVIISARISEPIKRLEKTMTCVENGDFEIIADIKGEEEVKQLSHTFNIMIQKIKQLMNQIIKEQEDKRKSELKALQAQINPHFLYNTLDSIVWMAENEENEGVITMVTALANLFRISISKGNDIIPINKEIEHVRNYLIIQQIRYMNKFDFVIDIDEEVTKYKTLKTILQPIVENAIYHGIKLMVDMGMIKITGKLIDDKICLEIVDNGVGMSRDTISNILKKNVNGKRRSGIGVKNVHERIQLYFGPEYGLQIESEIDVGTRVKVWLPKIENEED